jgi:hypothetical protein
MSEISKMTYSQLEAEWLACEHFINDPGDDLARIPEAIKKQIEIEAEQDRRSPIGENAEMHNDNE